MVGKRRVKTNPRNNKLPTSAKSMRIEVRNKNLCNSAVEDLGSKRQLRNRSIFINNPLIKHQPVTSNTNPTSVLPKCIVKEVSRSITNISIFPSHIDSPSIRPNPLFPVGKCEVGQDDEKLDFEPDDVLNSENPKNQLIVHRQNSDDLEKNSIKSNSSSSNYSERTQIVSKSGSLGLRNSMEQENVNFLPSHISDMIPYIREHDSSEDGRQNDYITYDLSSCSRTVINSSSSSGYSGNSQNSHQDEMEEDESMKFSEDYDLTNDEENKLLHSEDDDDIHSIETEPSPSISNKGIEPYKPQYVDQYRPTDDTAVPNQPILKDTKVVMKGFNIIMRASNTAFRKLLPKWDVRCQRDSFITLFLEDIGYVPPQSKSIRTSSECENSDTVSVTSSTESLTSFTNVKITVETNQARKCEPIQNNLQPEQNFGFKVPLPPTKRPPSRPKKSITITPTSSPCSSVSDISEKGLKDSFKIKPISRDEDAISISASTILDDFEHNNIKEEVEEYDPFSNQLYDVENWVTRHEVPDPEVCSSRKEESETNFRIMPNTATRINFRDIPPFFNGLCFRHYFYENCYVSNCKLAHTINGKLFFKRCEEIISTSADMQKLYSFTLKYQLLFRDLFPILIQGFGHYKMQSNLINSIDDVFGLKQHIKPIIAIEQIIGALQETGLTFLEAVEKISFNVGFMTYPELAEILLDLLSQRPVITDENWTAIKRISRAKDYIPPHILERILSRALCATPMNKDLCKDIYNVITKNDITDLSKVNSELLKPLKTISQFGNNILSHSIDRHLMTERERFESSTQNLGIKRFESPTQNVRIDASEAIRNNSATQNSHDRSMYPLGAKQQSREPGVSSTSSTSSNNSEVIRSEDIGQEMMSHQNLVYLSPSPQDISNLHSSPIIINTSVPPPPIPRVIVKNDTSPHLNQKNLYPEIPIPYPNQANFSAELPGHSRKDINLCPERPIFGKFNYNKDFSFDRSLHNLLPTSTDQVVMNEGDIKELNEIILKRNGGEFLNMLNQYKGPTTLQHFITMTIAHLKNCPGRPYNALIDLMENIGYKDRNFKTDRLLKGVFEVIIFNVLFFCERNCQVNDARSLIETFCDWDSLISSKQFALKTLTPIGRYIYLAKLLAKGNAFYSVYEILWSPDLRLLQPPENWPQFCLPKVDMESRNQLLKYFFMNSYRHNVDVCCDMYRNIFQSGNIYEFDAHCFFNPMLEYLINNEKISSLKYFYNNLGIFYSKMSPNILRAFIIFLDCQLSFKDKLQAYEMAASTGLYVPFTGSEPLIVIRTTMPDVELKLIFQYYMHQMRRSLRPHLVKHNLRIDIRLPDVIVTSPLILKKCIRSIYEVNLAVKKLFSECFGISLHQSEQDYNGTVIEVPAEALRTVFYR